MKIMQILLLLLRRNNTNSDNNNNNTSDNINDLLPSPTWTRLRTTPRFVKPNVIICYMYVYVHVFLSLSLSIYLYIYIYVCMHAHIYIYIYRLSLAFKDPATFVVIQSTSSITTNISNIHRPLKDPARFLLSPSF